MKKIYSLIGVILILFIIFLIVLLTPKNYQLKYQINNINITEKYLKKDKYYLFNITYKNMNYPLLIKKDYSRKRKLVNNIVINEEEQEKCLNIFIDKMYYICSENNNLKTLNTMSPSFKEKYYHLKENELKELSTYNNIDIYNLEHNYLIWNYKGFFQISKNNNKEINIFKNDNYKNYLTYQTEKYLVFPDYDSDYYFKKLYIYDFQTKTLKDISFNDEISYDTYYLGDIDNKVYFIDKKNKNEYELNLKKKSIKIISKDNYGIICNNGKWEEISLTKLINKEKKFTNNTLINYKIEDNTLYLIIDNKKIKITNNSIKQIIHINSNIVYYLSENKLYSYEYLKDEKLLLKYNEWNFNYNNHIFIFN